MNSINTNYFPSFTRTYKSKSNTYNDRNKSTISKKILAIAGITTGVILSDLFLAKGKVLSTITKGKISFIKNMSDDIDNVLKMDSYATKTRLDAFLSIPGLHAVWNHRLIHKLHEAKIPVIPRFLANISRFITDIEIHPGAKIGKQVFFDHTGAIVGETAEIGDNVTLIGRVVLGSSGKGNNFLRHTIVEDCATLGMNSTMLGRISIGKNTKIGAGTLVTHDVPADLTVIGNPAKIITVKGKRLKDPVFLTKNSLEEIKKWSKK